MRSAKYIREMLLSIPLLISTSFMLQAQSGASEPQSTSASVHTFFTAQEAFNPGMISRLKVPAGFTVSVAASGLGKPRMILVDDKNRLYVTRRDVGDVLLLHDRSNDGLYDTAQTIVADLPGVHGLAIRNGWLYLCATKKLLRGKLNENGTVDKMDTLINDLPDGGQHDNRTIGFSPDGKLFLTIGSDCNDCKESNPEHATILQLNEDGSGRKIYAKGLRNTLGFDWHPTTKELWGMDHGTDWRGDDIPPEELNRLVEGGDYGWPLVYGKQVPDAAREDPPGTTKAAYAKTTQPAIMTFPAHAAPLDFKFFGTATNLPADWKNDALVTWHGSWNKKKPDGFKVQRIRFENGLPVAAVDFLTGFLSDDGTKRFGRPVGITISKDGTVFISDDGGGVIYRVKANKKQ